MRSRFSILLAFGAGLMTACADGSFSGGGTSESKPSESSDEKENALGNADDDEAAGKPASVSGAYLTCAEQVGSTDESVAFGCSLADQTSQKPLPLAEIAHSWKWRAVPPAGAPASLQIKVEEQAAADFHALYTFSGAGNGTRAYAQVTQIALDADLKDPIDGFDGFRKKLQETILSDLGTPIIIGPDADGDRIPDSEDLCSNTPAGAYAHPDGEYVGCSKGQIRDKDQKTTTP